MRAARFARVVEYSSEVTGGVTEFRGIELLRSRLAI